MEVKTWFSNNKRPVRFLEACSTMTQPTQVYYSISCISVLLASKSYEGERTTSMEEKT